MLYSSKIHIRVRMMIRKNREKKVKDKGGFYKFARIELTRISNMKNYGLGRVECDTTLFESNA